jgi:hypothetical protein
LRAGLFCIPKNFSGPDNYFFLAATLDFADFAAGFAAALAAGLARSITVVDGCALAYPGFTYDPVTALRALLALLEILAMSNLVDLGAERKRRREMRSQDHREPEMWCCDCGCITFYQWSNGAVQCADCKTVQNGLVVPHLPHS